jgi:drug/metabolite transporter (DMT)-like permease
VTSVRKGPSARVRIGVVLGVAVIAAFCSTIVKIGLAYAPPLLFGGMRALIAGGALLAVAAASRHPLLPARRRWPATLAIAITATTASYGGMFLSPGRVGAGLAAVLGNVQPLLTVLLAGAVLGERVTRAKGAALLMGMAGVVLITSPQLRDGFGVTAAGSLLALAGSAGAAIGSVLVKRMKPGVDLLAVTAWQLILGSLPLLGAALVSEPIGQVTWGAGLATSLLFLSLIGTALSTAAWFWLIQYDDVGRLSLFLLLVPVLGLLLAVVLLGETVAPVEVAGMLFIVAGIALILGEQGAGSPLPGPRKDRSWNSGT